MHVVGSVWQRLGGDDGRMKRVAGGLSSSGGVLPGASAPSIGPETHPDEALEVASRAHSQLLASNALSPADKAAIAVAAAFGGAPSGRRAALAYALAVHLLLLVLLFGCVL